MKPLYGHTSQDTAYVVSGYPYGRLRTNIRFWNEFRPSKGYRFVSQTQNPKNGVWNNPRLGTYYLLAGGLYLDDQDHVQFMGLGEYSSAEEALAYVQLFQLADHTTLARWAQQKVTLNAKLLSGELVMTINKVDQPLTPTDIERHGKDMTAWKKVIEALRPKEVKMDKQRTLNIIQDYEHWALYPLLGVQRINHATGDVTKGVIIAGQVAVYEKDIATMSHEAPEDHGLAAGCRLAQQMEGVIKRDYQSYEELVEEGWEIPLA